MAKRKASKGLPPRSRTTKKKAPTEKATKKKSTRNRSAEPIQKSFVVGGEELVESPPKDGVALALAWHDDQAKEGKAKTKTKRSKAALMDWMREAGIGRMKVALPGGNEKAFVYEETPGVKTEAIAKPKKKK